LDAPPFPTITSALPFRASVTPDRIAYVVNGEPVTYAALAAEVSALAAALVALGVQRGDRCALLLPTSLDFIRLIKPCTFRQKSRDLLSFPLSKYQ